MAQASSADSQVRVAPAALSPAAGWSIAALFALSLLASLLVAVLTPAPDGAVAAVFAPGTRAATAVAAVVGAGGRLRRFGRAPWIAVAMPGPGPGDSGFAARLRAHGALVVLNPVVAGGCGAADRSADQG